MIAERQPDSIPDTTVCFTYDHPLAPHLRYRLRETVALSSGDSRHKRVEIVRGDPDPLNREVLSFHLAPGEKELLLDAEVIVVTGPPGVGKDICATRLAWCLSQPTAPAAIRTNWLRRYHFPDFKGYNSRTRYTPRIDGWVWHRVLEETCSAGQDGRQVVVVGTFLDPEKRRRFKTAVGDRRLVWIAVEASEETARNRIVSARPNGDFSEARGQPGLEVNNRFQDRLSSGACSYPDPAEGSPVIVIANDQAIDYPPINSGELRRAQTYLAGVRMLVYDLDGTLYPDHPELQARVQDEIIRRVKRSQGLTSLRQAKALFWQTYEQYGSATRAMIALGCGRKAIQDCLDAVDRSDVLVPDHRLAKMVERLSRRYRQAIVTNSGREVCRLTLELLGLDPRQFDPIITASDTVQSKPSPEPFEVLWNASNLNYPQCCMVGDREPVDIATPALLGTPTIQVGQQSPLATACVPTIYDVQQLLSS